MIKKFDYKRQVQTSVTNFIFCGDEYLFLKRKKDKKIDPGKLNGIGGRLEESENYLSACIRETEEETGYKAGVSDVSLLGVVKLEGRYEEDWIMCFFKIKVSNKSIPLGNETKDGKLIWIHKDKILSSGYELVDDIRYSLKEIIQDNNIFFINAKLDNEQKVISVSKSTLKR